MLGAPQDPGIMHGSLQDIFSLKDQESELNRVKVYISYLEIYNEGLIDLLNPKGDPSSLKIKEDRQVAWNNEARYHHQRSQTAESPLNR